MPENDTEASEKEAVPPGNLPAPAEPVPPPPPGEDWAVRYRYLLADFENFRRRVEREREGITRQARGGMVRELLPIIEAFRTARDALNHLPSSDPVRKGLELVDREWMKFLKHEGVEPVAEVGRPFRPEEAEAVGEAPATSEHPEGTVVQVVQQGYRFFGGLLRPAMVVVARGRAPDPNADAPASEEKHA
ncbi:MAG: nucleotide exchange factor GrpE [Thermoplasmata archaeon]|jgi:molecular chaperone GrpE